MECLVYVILSSSDYSFFYSLSSNHSLTVSDPYLCLFSDRAVATYLSQPRIQKSLGVDPAVQGNFTSYKEVIQDDKTKALDLAFPSSIYISALLQRGVRVLIYAGENDWVCNWVR